MTPVRTDADVRNSADQHSHPGVGCGETVRAGICDTCEGKPRDIQVPNRFDPDYMDDVPSICPECGRSSE